MKLIQMSSISIYCIGIFIGFNIMHSKNRDKKQLSWCISSQKKGLELSQTYFRYRWSILISVISELIGYVYEYKYVRDYLLYVLLYCMSKITIMRKLSLLLLFLLRRKLFLYCVWCNCEKRNLFTIFWKKKNANIK